MQHDKKTNKIIKRLKLKMENAKTIDEELQITFTICNLIDQEKLLKHLDNFIDLCIETTQEDV